MLDLYQEFNALIAKLSESGAPYALCGGMALAVYGIPRATVDMSSKGITTRLKRVSQLRALCLSLAKSLTTDRGKESGKEAKGTKGEGGGGKRERRGG